MFEFFNHKLSFMVYLLILNELFYKLFEWRLDECGVKLFYTPSRLSLNSFLINET